MKSSIMKRMFILFALMSSTVYSQVKDENNVQATGASNTTLTGKIGVGLLSGATPSLTLSIGDDNSGISGANDALDLVTAGVSRLSIATNGDISTPSEFTLIHPQMSTNFAGDRIKFNNHYTGGGWAKGLIEVYDDSSNLYYELGVYGSGQTYSYGYLGNSFSDNFLKWTPAKNFGVGLPSTDQPSLMLSIGDSDSGIVGGSNTLSIKTGNVDRLTIDSGGDINTTSDFTIVDPQMSTELVGDRIKFKNHYTGGGWAKGIIEVYDDSSNLYYELGAYGSGQTYLYGYLGNSFSDNFVKWTPAKNFGIGLPSTNQPSLMLSIGDSDSGIVGAENTLDFYTNNSSKLSISSNGNVGIGTTTPDGLLNIKPQTAGAISNDASQYQLTFTLSGSGTGDVDRNIAFRDNTSGNVAAAINAVDEGPSRATGIGFFTGDLSGISEKMIVRNDGNVGIGTSSPDEKLAVNGTIHAKEVRVDLTGWPDYVFTDEYSLLKLDDIEKFIKENGHLPNIPNAKDVEKNGIQLGEMNVKLLEKIEELTLHTIAQQKAIKLQKEKNKQLEERLIKLEKLMTKSN
nr:hypothetical protein [uncultured Psychroserpens sp.]